MEHTANLGPDSRPIPQPQPSYSAPVEPWSSLVERDFGGSQWARTENEYQQVDTEADPGSIGTSPPDWSLGRLLHDMSNETMVDCAFDWLLDEDSSNVPHLV
jgi:hypothetical protein